MYISFHASYFDKNNGEHQGFLHLPVAYNFSGYFFNLVTGRCFKLFADFSSNAFFLTDSLRFRSFFKLYVTPVFGVNNLTFKICYIIYIDKKSP